MSNNKLNNLIKATKYLVYILIFLAVIAILVAFIAAIIERISFGSWPELTGISPYMDPNQNFHRGKTLWDLLDLIIVPLVLAFGVFFLNQSARRVEQEKARAQRDSQSKISEDRNREATLQSYLDKMSVLILTRELLTSTPTDAVRDVARSRTLTTLRTLDGTRKGLLIRFLYETGLIDKKDPIVNLRGADLSEAVLIGANLNNSYMTEVVFDKANLKGVILDGATLTKSSFINTNLRSASLRWSNLREVIMEKANLQAVNMISANLDLANLKYSNLCNASLNKANFSDANLFGSNLSGANLSETSLFSTNLSGTMLKNAEVRTANFYWADLSNANLLELNLSNKQLEKARSLEGATMPDGSVRS